ncbi:MAG TPA: hypothetical protein VGR57_03280 [Ktedonobacterales bacterium]|nr:hypothetical protein [Ktedonobacterales bacterium]
MRTNKKLDILWKYDGLVFQIAIERTNAKGLGWGAVSEQLFQYGFWTVTAWLLRTGPEDTRDLLHSSIYLGPGNEWGALAHAQQLLKQWVDRKGNTAIPLHAALLG